MRIIGCDFHTRQQTLAMLDTETGELVEMTLLHEGNNVREFYSALPRPVRVGIEATGSITPKGFSEMHFRLLVVDGGKEMLAIEADPNTVVSGTLQLLF